MYMLDSLHDFLVNVHSFVLDNKTESYLEYKCESLQLKIKKDLTDFEVFSLDGKQDVFSIKERISKYIKDPMGVLKSLLQECIDDEEEIEDDEVDGFDDSIDTLDKVKQLPNCECNRDRQLLIYVWGRKKRKYLHHKVDHNFNGAVLYGKKAGTDWSKDGRTEAIRIAVMKCPLFNDFLETMIKTIEKKDASKIGINCRAGRHRSVTLAWILKEHYYPNAKIDLLEIK